MAAPSAKDSLQYFLIRPSSLPPNKQSADAAGFDLHADLGDELSPSGQNLVIPPGESAFIGTGVVVTFTAGTYGRVAPRCGLPLDIDMHGGILDSDYRGEVKVILVNNGDKAFTVRQGDRVAQLILEKFADLDSVRVDGRVQMDQAVIDLLWRRILIENLPPNSHPI